MGLQPCDTCGEAAGSEGLIPAGRWEDGTRKMAHPSCIARAHYAAQADAAKVSP